MIIAYNDYIEKLVKKRSLNKKEQNIVNKYKRIKNLVKAFENIADMETRLIIRREIYAQNIELCQMVESYSHNTIEEAGFTFKYNRMAG